MSRPEALRRARELRKTCWATRAVFNQSKFFEDLVEECQDLSGSALEGLCAWAAQKVDDESKSRDDEEEPSLFPELDIVGELHFGNGDRILKKDARIEHYQAALALDDQNLQAVKKANRRKHDILKILTPYWGNGKSMLQAAEAWRSAQEGTG
jgi:hypothetical protein